MTRAALQAVVALPADMSTYNTSASAAAAQTEMASSTTSQLTTQNAIDANIYTNANLVATINDGQNANNYIGRLLTNESSRVSASDAAVRNEQFKLRAKLLELEYLVNYYSTGVALVVLTLFVSLLLLTLAALWRADKVPLVPFVIAAGFMIAVYAVVVVSRTAKVSSRRPTSWSERTWSVKNQSTIKNASFSPYVPPNPASVHAS